MRRRPAEPGHRPRAGVRFAMGWCAAPGCRETFVVDRDAQPWARARTCSDYCRARLGNHGRNASNCRHCDLVESYRLARDADIRENIEIAAGDERAPLTFRQFLTGSRMERDEPCDVVPADELDDDEWWAAWGHPVPALA